LGVNWYDHHARYYDAEIGRWWAVDPALQAVSPYMAMGNNPMMYIDENGEFWHIVICATIGGIINLAMKASQGKINSWGDGFMAFGIGAVAGAVGAATGGSSFVAAGGGAAGAGGFAAGSYAAAVSAASSMPIQNGLNHLYFGDPLMTPAEYAQGIAFAAVLGGTINGTVALANGRSFMNGTLNSGTNTIPIQTIKPEQLKPADVKESLKGAEKLPTTRGENLPEPATYRKVDLPGERTEWVREYKSFSAFKRTMEPAGDGKAWHHLVEQNPSNISKFGPEAIHNAKNVIKLPHGAGTIHARISGYYSSKQAFTGGFTVRQWLSTKSYNFQYNFGINKLKDLGWTP